MIPEIVVPQDCKSYGAGSLTVTRFEIYNDLISKFWDGSPFGPIAMLLNNSATLEDHVEKIIHSRGVFSAIQGRKYFTELVERYLIPQVNESYQALPNKEIENWTFREFFNLTGVDIVVTGTNITFQSPVYFSLHETPDFPLIEAVQISMNIPGIFKPVYVDTNVNVGQNKAQDKYRGLYVDGGMLNNIPIRAFDDIVSSNEAMFLSNLTYRGSKNSFLVAGNPNLVSERNDSVLGFRLTKPKNEVKDKDKIYPENDSVFFDFIDELVATLMYPAEEGILVNPDDRASTVQFSATIEIDNGSELKKYLNELPYFSKIKAEAMKSRSFTIGVADFSTPVIDERRGRTMHASLKKRLMQRAGEVLISFLDESE